MPDFAALANDPAIQRIRQVRPLRFLPGALRRNSPRFPPTTQMVQENPAYLQPLLQQLAQNSPQLAQAMNDNPEAVMDLLGLDEDDLMEGEGGMGQDGPNVIRLTEEEAEAVRRVSPDRGLQTRA